MPHSETLPKDRIVVHNGKVQRHDDYCLWNGVPVLMIQVGREQDPKRAKERGEFFLHINDPEHGGRSWQGTLSEVLVGLNVVLHRQYHRLFALQNPTPNNVRQLGFTRFKLVDAEQAVA